MTVDFPLQRSLIRCGLVLAIVAPSVLAAQGKDTKSHDKECDKAARIVAKGHPEKKEQDALATLAGCGVAGASAFAAGIAQYTTETDVPTLAAFMDRVDNWRDSTVMEAVVALATNTAASPQARVFAVRYLITRLQPSLFYSYAGLTAGPTTTINAEGTTLTTTGCRASAISDPGDLSATPLPADYADRVIQTLTLLINASTTPIEVRNAARCAR